MNLREHETDMRSISGRPCTRQAFSVTCHDKSPNSSPRFGENVAPNRPICDDVSPVLSDSDGPGATPPGAAAAAADAASGGEAAGLVHSPTSGTPSMQVIRVDREASRLKRLRCSVLTAARLHVQQRARWKVCMLTLTYRPDVDWAPGQISALVRHVRQYLKRKGVEMRHVWVQEFTKKGKPHYHMLLWLPLGLTLPKPDKRGWWSLGWTRIEWARNAVGYIAKYASKADSLHRPEKGARMHGNGGLTDEAVVEQRWWKLPGWLRHSVKPSDRVRRAEPGTGGGFVHPETGEVYRSPWVVFFKGGQVFIERRSVA